MTKARATVAIFEDEASDSDCLEDDVSDLRVKGTSVVTRCDALYIL